MNSAEQSRSPVKPEHRLRAAALRPPTSRASSEPPTTIFEERPTIPMWGLAGVTPARQPAEVKAEPVAEIAPPPPVPAPAPIAPAPVAVKPAPIAPAPVAVEPAPAPRRAKLQAPTFGAGMLQARKVRTPDPEVTQRIRPAAADGPTFGANVLRSQNSAGKWVALALALAAIVAVIAAAL